MRTAHAQTSARAHLCIRIHAYRMHFLHWNEMCIKVFRIEHEFTSIFTVWPNTKKSTLEMIAWDAYIDYFWFHLVFNFDFSLEMQWIIYLLYLMNQRFRFKFVEFTFHFALV